MSDAITTVIGLEDFHHLPRKDEALEWIKDHVGNVWTSTLTLEGEWAEVEILVCDRDGELIYFKDEADVARISHRFKIKRPFPGLPEEQEPETVTLDIHDGKIGIEDAGS